MAANHSSASKVSQSFQPPFYGAIAQERWVGPLHGAAVLGSNQVFWFTIPVFNGPCGTLHSDFGFIRFGKTKGPLGSDTLGCGVVTDPFYLDNISSMVRLALPLFLKFIVTRSLAKE